MIKFIFILIDTFILITAYATPGCSHHGNCTEYTKSSPEEHDAQALSCKTLTYNSSDANVNSPEITISNISECEMSTPNDLHCKLKIPTNIPDHVRTVYLEDIQSHVWNKTGLFCDKSWVNVTYMSISEDIHNLTLPNNTFVGLDNLKTLRIHTNRYFGYDLHTLYGIPTVQTLDLYRCTRMTFYQVLMILKASDVLPNLTNLSLEKLSEYFNVFPKIHFNHSAQQILSSKRITNLNLSGTTIKADFTKNVSLWNTIRVFNLSDTIMFADVNSTFTCPNLHTLDLSGGALPLSFKQVNHNIIIKNHNSELRSVAKEWYLLLQNLEQLHLSHMVKFSKPEYHTELYNITLKGWPKTLHSVRANRNGLQHLDVELIDSNLQEADLSHNVIEYISRKSIRSIGNSITSFLLSHNELHKMLSIELELLFHDAKLLKHLDLSYNNLESILSKTFINNKCLEVLDLSSNKLSNIAFQTNTLVKLNKLVLKGNNIMFLGAEMINTLQWIYEQQSHDRVPKLLVNLQDNSLTCDCPDLPFVTWLATSPMFQNNNSTVDHYSCVQDGTRVIPVDQQAITAVKEICDVPRQLLIFVLSISIPICVCLIALALTVYKCKIMHNKRIEIKKIERNKQNEMRTLERNKQIEMRTLERNKQNEKRNFERNVQHIQNGKLGDGVKFLVFVSFKNDSQFVQYILGVVEETLKRLTNCTRALINSDKDISPGAYDLKAKQDRIEISAGLIVVVTNENSDDFILDSALLFAKGLKKKAILLFQDTISAKNMSPYLQHFYVEGLNKGYVAKWTKTPEEPEMYQFDRDWEKLCIHMINFIEKLPRVEKEDNNTDFNERSNLIDE